MIILNYWRELLIIAFIPITALLIYFPAIYYHVMVSIYEKRIQRGLQVIEDSGLFEKCRIIITSPLGIGTEPAGETSFAIAMKNQGFAMKSIMNLVND